MKRFVAALAAVGSAVFGFTPTADAVGYGACVLAGTISFTPESPIKGSWTIGAANLDCQGVIGKRARIIGRGPFRGSGTYTALLPAGTACFRQSGTGMVDYEIPTASGMIKVSEAVTHTLAGAGVLDTPTLHGTFQLPPPYHGDCVTEPVSRAAFVAQLVLHRNPRRFPPSGAP